MKCPHCLEGFHANWRTSQTFAKDSDGLWMAESTICPECRRAAIKLLQVSEEDRETICETLIRPKAMSRAPLPKDIPEAFAGDYREACLVLADSAKASAALSRRCLQHVLREKGRFTGRNLDTEIQMALDSRTLPTYITEALDAVRVIGGFAAHPTKSTATGEIMDVEPGEAEQQLDTLELLFDFYFVAPAIAAAKKAAINAKLIEAGKPPLK